MLGPGTDGCVGAAAGARLYSPGGLHGAGAISRLYKTSTACRQRHGLGDISRESLPQSMSPREPADPRLGRAIRELREAARVTQEDVAYRAGISTGSLSRIECSVANPSWTT